MIDGPGSTRLRHDHARSPTIDTVIEGSDRGARRAARAESQDGEEWRGLDFVHDARMGPDAPRSTVLTPAQEAMVVAFRRHTLLALDDCLYALQATMPHQTPSQSQDVGHWLRQMPTGARAP